MTVRGSINNLGIEGASGWIFGKAFVELHRPSLAAAGHALAVEQTEIRPLDIVLVGPGTLYRIYTPEGLTALMARCAPARTNPMSSVINKIGGFTVRHLSDATPAV
jgi:hypothetical protein